MIPVASSNIAGYDYDPVNRILRIQFTSGRTYSYKDVPENLVDEFSTADSKGRFLNENIKNNYSLA
jgi:hypothetical protein